MPVFLVMLATNQTCNSMCSLDDEGGFLVELLFDAVNVHVESRDVRVESKEAHYHCLADFLVMNEDERMFEDPYK